MNEASKLVERVIGLDAHPDSFTAAVIRGPTPAAAIVEKIFNKLPLGQLQSRRALAHLPTRQRVPLPLLPRTGAVRALGHEQDRALRRP